MNQGNAMESSALVALTGLNVVIEDEGDYVFVAGDLDDDPDWWDDESSYDRCDLSPALSCATSVATNVTLRDLNYSNSNLVEDSGATGAVGTGRDGGGGGDPGRAGRRDGLGDGKARPPPANPKNGRRISNKRLRRRTKARRRAAAARAAAEALAARGGGGIPNAGVVAHSSTLGSVRESLAAYRGEIEAGKARKEALLQVLGCVA